MKRNQAKAHKEEHPRSGELLCFFAWKDQFKAILFLTRHSRDAIVPSALTPKGGTPQLS